MSTATAERLDWLQVGHGLVGREQFDLCPIGTVIKHDSAGTYTKQSEFMWSQEGWDGLRDHRTYFSKEGQNYIVSLPVWQVGDVLRGPEDFAAMPVGTVFVCKNGVNQRCTKEAENTWKRDGYSRRRPDSWFDPSHHDHVIESLPDGVVLTKNHGGTGLRTVESVEELRSLAVGTAITTAVPGHSKTTWTVIDGGRLKMNDGGAELPVEHFTGSINAGQCTIGVTPEAGQVYRDGDYTYLLHQRGSEGWYMGQFYGEVWNNVVVQVDPPGTLTSTPGWMTGIVKRMVGVVCDNQSVLNARGQKITELTAKVDEQGAQKEKLRRAFVAIEKGKVGKDDLRSYIDSVLTENGLKALDQTVTVTTTVHITQYVRIQGTDLRQFIPDAAEDSVVSDARTPLTFTRTFDRDVDVEPGACGCGQIGNAQMREWINEQRFTDLYSHSIQKRTCTSENCVYKSDLF